MLSGSRLKKKLKFSGHIFVKRKSSKIHEDPSWGAEILFSMRTERQTDGQTDVIKLIVGVRKSSKAPKKKVWLTEKKYKIKIHI